MGQCSVCEIPEIMQAVDDLLDANVFLADISARLALRNPPVHIHRSSIFRHKKLHYAPRLRLRMLEKKARGPVGRLIVEWPESLPGAEKLPTLCFDEGDVPPREISADQIRDSDTCIVVGFEPANRPRRE